MKMIINDRELTIVQYCTEKNWFDKIPNKDWLCIIIDNNKPRRYLEEVISKILIKDVSYVCTIGDSCEKVHDLIDEEIAFREVDIDNLYLPKHDIMTTWHNDFDEGIWFGLFAAHHDEVVIKEVVILDLTDGVEIDRVNKIISKIILEN